MFVCEVCVSKVSTKHLMNHRFDFMEALRNKPAFKMSPNKDGFTSISFTDNEAIFGVVVAGSHPQHFL